MRRPPLPGITAAALLLAAMPAAVQAQAGKTYRIGLVETRSAPLNAANVDALRQGLRELGYKEGENLAIEYRSSDGHDERFPALLAELVRLNVDVIVTRGTPAALAAKRATRKVPVVMAAAGDPVSSGIVESLARPGGNITGMSSMIPVLHAKRVELLREINPTLSRVAAIFNMGNPVIPAQWETVESTARTLGIEARLLDVRRPEDLRTAFDTATRHRAEALMVGVDGVTQANLRLIAEFVARQRLPSIYGARDYVEVGGLMAYGASDQYMYYRAASYVDRILKGARPADLPVEQPTTFELAINLKAARALGLTVPPSLLLRADRLIE